MKMKKSHILIAVLIIVLLYIIYSAIPTESKTNPPPPQKNTKNAPPQGYTEYSKRLQWIWNDIDLALERAKSENKLVLVDFWAGWCGWCAKADKEVFPTTRVEDVILKYYIPIKIDTDAYPQIQMKYEVRGLPTIVILDKDGKIKGTIVGFRKAEEFVTLLLQFVGGSHG